MEGLPHTPLHYEHVQESVYICQHFCELLTVRRSHANTTYDFKRGGAMKLKVGYT